MRVQLRNVLNQKFVILLLRLVDRLHTDGCQGAFSINPKNIGNSPAVRVREHVILTPSIPGSAPFAEGFNQLAQKRLTLSTGPSDGHTHFPHEERGPLTYKIKIPKTEIDAAIAQSKNGLIQFDAVVSVDYEFAGGAGNTTRTYFVWTRGTEVLGKWSLLDPQKGEYSVEDIVVTGVPAKNSAT